MDNSPQPQNQAMNIKNKVNTSIRFEHLQSWMKFHKYSARKYKSASKNPQNKGRAQNPHKVLD